MSDIVDEANQLAERLTVRATARLQMTLQGEGQAYCIDCGDEIPQKRREACPSARRCIDCQEKFEGGNAWTV